MTTGSKLLELLHDILQTALPVLTGFPLAKQIEVGTVKDAYSDHRQLFLFRGRPV